MTRAERNIAWIEAHCRVPEGRLIGKPVRLRGWQREDMRKIYDNPVGTRLAILSFGRKSGKTAFAAFLLLLHLCGPEALANSQLYSAAQSRDQASLLYKLAAKMIRLSPDLSRFVVLRETVKELYCPEMGTLYRALSADATTSFGISPVFIVHDELGQVKGPRSQLYDALETATGAQENPLSVVISTQAPTDADLLSVLIDDALRGDDPTTVISLYTAPTELDPFDDETIKLANPAFGDFQNDREVRRMAQDAKRMPSKEASFRNLVLNQRIETSNPFVSKSVWVSCGDPVCEGYDGLEVYGGLDLAEVNDLCALVLIAKVKGVWQVWPTFWLPEDGLLEKSRNDRVPYDLWAKEDLLVAVPGRSIEYEYVAEHLKTEVFDRCDVQRIGFDRWNFRHFKPWLVKKNFSEPQLACFEEFGQGFQSMSPALRELESILLNKKLAHGNHPVLTMCAANAVVQSDPSGNRKLSKMKSRGRIDGMIALAMAASVAAASSPEEEVDLDGFLSNVVFG